MYFIFEILGTVAFAISGAKVAIEKDMDILGVIILGITTAIGGGTIRDLILGINPPANLITPVYPLLAIAVSIIVFIPKSRAHINVDSTLIVLIDSIGLGTFTVTGLKTAIPYNSVMLELFLAVLTGVGGGVLRDIFAMEKPIIFVKHFYALASFIGAAVCLILMPLGENLAMSIGIVVVVTLRMLAAKYKWNLPKA